MDVTVVCFGAMREYLPDPATGKARVQMARGSTVEQLVEQLGAPVALLHTCLIDGRRVGAHQVLHDGVEVTLMPPFSGGATAVRSPDA
jgi:molybdopterin converting factor small subunit